MSLGLSSPKLAVKLADYRTAEEFIQQNCKQVDCCFCDPLGVWHHCTFMPSQCDIKDLESGFAFDGSSIRLFTNIEASDMMMVPDLNSAWMDPFTAVPTLHFTCSIQYPHANEAFARDPRGTAQRAIQYMKDEKIADSCIMGPEAEFFVFDSVRMGVKPNKCFYEIDGAGGTWNESADYELGNTGHRMPHKAWYFPTAPIDKMTDLRSEMLLTMYDIGMPAEKHHHEVATLQGELGYTCCPLLECADWMMAYKYIIKNVAKKHGKSATFMPKPMAGDNGSGMHVHQSLWRDNKNLFFDENGTYAKFSKEGMYYIGGLLKHANAVLAFTNPTLNSYKRLVPGYEAPVNLVYSKANRSAAIRIPVYRPNEMKHKRLEFRCPDASGCPYLAFAAMLMAGLDGIKNKVEPGPPCDKDVFDLTVEEKMEINLRSTPHQLSEAIDALEKDHDFLTAGGVFKQEFIDAYIAFKRKEIKNASLVPTPMDYLLYYTC